MDSYQSIAANPAPDLQESLAMATNPNQSFAGRTGDTQVPDIELVVQRPTDMLNGYPNSSAHDSSLVAGDLNAPQRACNSLRFSGVFECAWAGESFLFTLVVSAVLGATLLIYIALDHPSPVLIISTSLFTAVVSVTVFLLIAGWTRGNGKMVRIGEFLARLEFYLMMVLFVLLRRGASVNGESKRKRGQRLRSRFSLLQSFVFPYA
ncbi:hypothetical protein ACJRO7_000179 [Eucalyptus globulus]|uniref:Uncharacterized protein n=1 Tax=Eucalyptus globulus TaxID=34317 RepID=A0ABD3LLQ7_EUCGL